MSFSPEKIRKDFPMYAKEGLYDGLPLVYLDNAATTFKPYSVIQSQDRYYTDITANAHRGDYGLAHAVDVQGTDALLAIGDPGGRRSELAGEIVLQRRHTGVDEQQGIVVLGHQGKALQPQVALAFKKAEKPLSDFIESQFFHGSSLHPCYFSSFSTRRRKKALSCTCFS